ncbi:hypothetical protein BP6252_02886 [Coleophoma cylindrospora]|uniref:Peptidase A1 domain-containing protein n=1 Tax=Coleophoma cylindrospora TaxID=1849047 RepID=A0A3D8SG70_9HELO|nr:hypothetical protein BP6252_02886 [Coleophoma cylindrospora]
MKLENGRNCLAVALAIFAAKVEGEFKVAFVDDFTHGVVKVGIGSPATTYDLILDTGSANTWVGAEKKFVVTKTSYNTDAAVNVVYPEGSFSGNEYFDTLVLGGTTLKQQAIGVASRSEGYYDVDGILALGPTALSAGTVSGYPVVPTVLDNLYASGIIDTAIVTIGNNLITFGSPLLQISNLMYAPTSSGFWGFDASLTYGSTTLLSNPSVVIDYGTPLIGLSTGSYNSFLKLTGAIQDPQTSLPKLDTCNSLVSLLITFGGQNLYIPPSQYIWPQAQNDYIGGDATKCYLGVTDLESRGSDVVLGYNTLKHFTVVLDKTHSRVGLANLDIEL